MKSRYMLLLAGIVVAAVMISLLGRMSVPPPATPPAEPPAPRVALELAVDGTRVIPALAQVEKDHAVSLVVVNTGPAVAEIALAGYEDRVRGTIGPGERLELEFVADRPGEGFAWLVDGKQAGRLIVAGSHLVEGHR